MKKILSFSQSSDILDVLHGILRILSRSLPQYLSEARPWMQSADFAFQSALNHLVSDQRYYAQRVADAIVERGGHPAPGPYDLEYAAANDLSLDFLRKRIREQLLADFDVLSLVARKLADHHELHALAEEIIGNYRGHLEVLGEKRIA